MDKKVQNLESMELKISYFLRIGVIFSGVLIFAGWMMNLKWSHNPFHDFQSYDVITFKELLRHYLLRENYGALITYAGLASLISLPIIRVFLTFCLFVRQKEWALAVITALVLLGLAVSFTFGIEL